MILNALKWLVRFLETRFPAKVIPVSRDEFKAFEATITRMSGDDAGAIAVVKLDIEKMQKQIEILNLRVGLTRPTQAAFGRKLNG